MLDLARAAAEAIVNVGAPNLTKDLADQLLPEAIAVVQTFTPDGLELARALNALSDLLVSQGRIREAEPLIARASTIVKQYDGPDHHGLRENSIT